MKTRIKQGTILFLLALAITLLPHSTLTAKAATAKRVGSNWIKAGSYYVKQNDSNGNLSVTKNKNSGKKKTLKATYSSYVSGRYIYYRASNSSGSREYIYRYDTKKKSKKKLASAVGINFYGYRNGYIYYTTRTEVPIGLGKQITYKQKVSNGKKKKLPNCNSALYTNYMYKNYIVGLGMRFSADPVNLSVLNLKTNKLKTIEKNCMNAKVMNGKIYYVATADSTSKKTVTWKIGTCNLDGSGKKTLSSFSGSSYDCSFDFYSSYLVESKYTDDGWIYQKRNYSGGAPTRLSNYSSSYRKVNNIL